MYRTKYFNYLCGVKNLELKNMKQNKGGRPHTGRDNRQTIKLSKEAVTVLATQPNKSAYIDALIRGEAAQICCPCCGATITIKTKD